MKFTRAVSCSARFTSSCFETDSFGELLPRSSMSLKSMDEELSAFRSKTFFFTWIPLDLSDNISDSCSFIFSNGLDNFFMRILLACKP